MSPLTPAQLDAVTDLGANRCVTSGAGCGKTRVLVERYVHFLEQDLALPLSRLAAITFTENAAAEMRDRIRQACRSQVDAARKTNDRVRLETWLQRYWDVDMAPIDTIHGFSASLLRRYPIEAGVDPQFRLLDEAESAFLRQDVLSALFEERLGAEDADLLAVLEHVSLAEAREVLGEIVEGKREVLRRVAGPVMAQSDDEILKQLHKAVDEHILTTLRDVIAGPDVRTAVGELERLSGDPDDKLEQLRGETLAHVERLRTARTARIAAEAATWIAGNVKLTCGSAKRWPSADALKAAKDALGRVRDPLKTATEALTPYDEDVERVHLTAARALYRTAQRAVSAYQGAKRDRSALDFEDLQIFARDLLAGNQRVLEECRRRFRAILVDELQDTNSLQFEIVRLLTSAPAGRRQETPMRPGALFGVGDPKQSIYRFRGAEVEVFDEALRRVGQAGRKGLSESFRLHPGTAGLVNHLFSQLMGEAYEPIIGMRDQKNEAVGEMLVVQNPDDETPDAEARHTQEAACLAARLREIVDHKAVTVCDVGAPAGRPARWGDVAILLRRTTYLHVYEEALERQAVPYYVVAGGGFYKQQEVLDVVHLLRVLDDPADDLHLAGVLRSPLFAVTDEGLYRLRSVGTSLYESLALAAGIDNLDPEDRRGIQRAAAVLPKWLAAKDRFGLGALVDEVAIASGYAAASVGRFGGARAHANLRQMVELARRFERQGFSALGDYIDYVTDVMQSEMRAEQAPIDAPGGDTVRLMTIHKAKGLEFPVVVIPDLGYVPRGTRSRYFIQPVTGLAIRLRDEDGESRTSSALALSRQADAAAEAQEGHRILYVAMTRAKDYLIFSGHGGYNVNYKSWLGTMLRGLKATGDSEVRLPTGHVMRISAHLPQRTNAGRGRRRVGPRDVFSAGRVRWDQLRDRGQQDRAGVGRRLARVAPPGVPPRRPSHITATALVTYQRCPRLYWWQHVLGVGQPEPPGDSDGLSPRRWGVVCHRALELAASADPAAVRTAVEGALRELPTASATARDGLRERLRASVAAFWASSLGQRVARARQVLREMPFLLAWDGTEIRGTMDLVFEGADGRWELVDYKSSGPDAGSADEAAGGYDLQLGLYALAAGRWLGQPIARWSVYFLGSGATAERDVAAADLKCAEEHAKKSLEGIAATCYDSQGGNNCRLCDFRWLCDTRSTMELKDPKKGGRDDL